MPKESQNMITTETETSGNGVEHSKASRTSGGAVMASPVELELALEKSQQTIAMLQAQIEAQTKTKSSSDDITKLTNVIAEAIKSAATPSAPAGPMESDNLNRSTDYKNQRDTVDGRSLMEAQQTLQGFRNEVKKPISISKMLAAFVGPSLAVTVNGVRVCIPCDGKTYYINETHWEHAKERLAKIDRQNIDDGNHMVEID